MALGKQDFGAFTEAAVMLVALLATQGLGCGSSTPATAHQVLPCVTPGASYRVQFTENSGNCPAIPDQTVHTNSDGTIQVPQGCTGGVQDTGCSLTLNMFTCMQAGFTTTETGTITLTNDGLSGSGMVTISVTYLGSTCSGQYSVSYTRM